MNQICMHDRYYSLAHVLEEKGGPNRIISLFKPEFMDKMTHTHMTGAHGASGGQKDTDRSG